MLGLEKYYQDLWKSFQKITMGNWNICQILKIFLLPTVEISFFNRVDLRNGAAWTPQTLHFFWSKNFGWAYFQPLLASKNSRPELLSLRRKIKKYENFLYCPNTFFPFSFFNISSTERVQRLKFSSLWFQKSNSHQLLGHSSLIIYWSSHVLCVSFIMYISPLIFSYPLIVHCPFKKPSSADG